SLRGGASPGRPRAAAPRGASSLHLVASRAVAGVERLVRDDIDQLLVARAVRIMAGGAGTAGQIDVQVRLAELRRLCIVASNAEQGLRLRRKRQVRRGVSDMALQALLAGRAVDG